ncbi:hypothetical protein FNB79_13885 [Formosa sediminum]|uniref:Uncharacterized protein n=1 Tax=Formosa sediminum TaxID=2594004 RepID=A0A516GU15_9FLAO|nr:hypothetical protein [Formosa sediminum]QDO95014.1 hypothetical protein FNB79_13885 [Formosa sediminum]
MANKRQTSKNGKLKYLLTDSRSIITGSIIATFIAATPYLFYLYESVPENVKVWHTFLFTYESTFYGGLDIVAWTLTGKLVPLLLLFIWFFTCRHWWYHVLIVPIAMYSFQIFTILNDDINYVDSNQILYLMPIMAIIIPSIYLIRARIFHSLNTVDKSLQDLEDEFKISPRGFKDRMKDYF